jgi:hypothetical protein
MGKLCSEFCARQVLSQTQSIIIEIRLRRSWIRQNSEVHKRKPKSGDRGYAACDSTPD